jgi:hypothetical protein
MPIEVNMTGRNHRQSSGFVFWVLILMMTTGLMEQNVAAQSKRGVMLIPQALHEQLPFNPQDSAGIFVGVREFPKDDQIADVPYGVDDAIDLAHLFSLEMGLVFPHRVHR